jgi:hypothetical protein
MGKMSESKKGRKKRTSKSEIASFKAYKKKFFPKKYAEEESKKVQPLKLRRQ